MNFRMLVGLILAAGLVAGRSAMPTGTAPRNPYDPIVERNMFDLQPIPVHNPADDVVVSPPPKITPNGIMRLFGKLQVLFKVAEPGKPGQPPKDESYTLGEGERQEDITVKKIDEAAASITFDNHGTIQELPLVASTGAAAGGPAPGPGGGMPPIIPAPVNSIAPAPGGVPIGFGGRFGRNRNVPGAGNPGPAPSLPSFGTAATPAVPNNPAPAPQASYEEQVITMEQQRAKWLDEGNPNAVIIPPTPLTSQLTGEGGNGGAPVLPP